MYNLGLLAVAVDRTFCLVYDTKTPLGHRPVHAQFRYQLLLANALVVIENNSMGSCVPLLTDTFYT
jgi:hypothetical protein